MQVKTFLASHSYHNLYRDLLFVRPQEFLKFSPFVLRSLLPLREGLCQLQITLRILSLAINTLYTNQKNEGK